MEVGDPSSCSGTRIAQGRRIQHHSLSIIMRADLTWCTIPAAAAQHHTASHYLTRSLRAVTLATGRDALMPVLSVLSCRRDQLERHYDMALGILSWWWPLTHRTCSRRSTRSPANWPPHQPDGLTAPQRWGVDPFAGAG